jgi:hypothetical protein
MIHHVSVGSNDLERARAHAVMPAIGFASSSKANGLSLTA